jgi:Ankyrin repeats (3 copies)
MRTILFAKSKCPFWVDGLIWSIMNWPQNMDDMKLDISPRYYIAETTVWLLGAIIAISRFIGLAPFKSLPVLNVTLKSQQHSFRVVAAMIAVATFYLIFEWKQSPQEARRSYWARSRAGITTLFSCVSLWLCYPFIAGNTRFAGISPAWYFGFWAIGYLLGSFGSSLALASLMIRTPSEDLAIHISRIPAATRAQFKSWIPVVTILLVAYYVLCYKAPVVIIGLAYFIVAIPFAYKIGALFASLCLHQDKDGKRISYAKRIAAIKEAFDSHDYSYYLIDQGNKFTEEFGISTIASPETLQKAIRDRFSIGPSSGLVHFHTKLQEEIQLNFYPKDGILDNLLPVNRGFRILKHQGKKDLIRVLVIPEETDEESKELEIQTCIVEELAEKYLSTHTEDADLAVSKIFSYAIDHAVIQTMNLQAGPLLQQAVITGQEEKVEELLKQDVNVNERAEASWTPLLHAVAQGYPRIVLLLLDAGANTDMGNLHGITPLMYTARYGNIEVCRILLEYGANPNLQDLYGWTALMVAARLGHADVAELLLKEGASVNIKDRKAMTALDYAHKNKQGKIAKMIRTANKRLPERKSESDLHV